MYDVALSDLASSYFAYLTVGPEQKLISVLNDNRGMCP